MCLSNTDRTPSLQRHEGLYVQAGNHAVRSSSSHFGVKAVMPYSVGGDSALAYGRLLQRNKVRP